MTSAFGTDLVYDSAMGEFISQKHQRIAEIIADYNPYLRLLYVPKNDRAGVDDIYPFAVGYAPPGLEPQVVMRLQEHEVDERLLARIFMSDSSKHNVLEYLESLEAAQQLLKMKEEMDAREEARQKAEFMIRSPLHTINMGNGKKVRT